MALPEHQKLSRIFPGQPFGDGHDGNYTSTTKPTITYGSCSGTASSTVLNVTISSPNDGEIVLIHQSRGTGHGNWEFNQIVSGGTSPTLNMAWPLAYTYLDDGTSSPAYNQAQVLTVKMYETINVASGIWDITTWRSKDAFNWGDPAFGGIGVYVARQSAIFKNAVRINGAPGTPNDTSFNFGRTGGYWGGFASNGDEGTSTNYGSKGEGYLTNAFKHQTTATDSGGAGARSQQNNGGGGGGHAAVGSTGSAGAPGGLTQGNSELSGGGSLHFGGGGGGGHTTVNSGDFTQGGGGAGGGIIMAITKNLTVDTGGLFQALGGAGGGTQSSKGGGGAAGGSILVQCQNATIGTNRLNCYGGGGGSGGGNGSAGRIAIHHSGAVTGTSNPTYTDVIDGTLTEPAGAFIFNLV